MNTKQNQKFQSTHKAIEEALLALLREKNIQQVTVSEICRNVGINRSTFYLHFLDVYDVLEKMAGDIAAELETTRPENSRDIAQLSATLVFEPRREDIFPLLEHIRQHREFYTLYFRQGLPLAIQKRFFHTEHAPSSVQAWAELGFATQAEIGYHHVIFAAAFDATLSHWLERGCIETNEELYAIIRKEFRSYLIPQ